MISESTYQHTEEMHNTIAASLIVPYIIKMLQPSSVIDVGCGIGTWLYEFKKAGVSDVLGIDSPYADQQLLKKYLNPDEFKGWDLTKPFSAGRKFDVAISLEVAEHLPPETALQFVDHLANHADTIIFSAAVPAQVGQNHLNEQWPTYWAKRFEAKGYHCYDLVRPQFWNHPDVEVWYKQNILLYSKVELPFQKTTIHNIIHPELWSMKVAKIDSLKYQLDRIVTGKAGASFYIKAFLKSLIMFGKKVK